MHGENKLICFPLRPKGWKQQWIKSVGQFIEISETHKNIRNTL